MHGTPARPPESRAAIARRLITLLELVATGDPHSLAGLARRAMLPRTTTYRLLRMLQGLDMVDRLDARYVLGHRFGRLVSGATRHERDLRRIVMPVLFELARHHDLIVRLLVLRGDEVVAVERLFGHRYARAMQTHPDRVPARLTTAGRLLLAPPQHDPVTPHARSGQRGQRPLRPVDVAPVDPAREHLDRVEVPVVGPDGRPVAVIELAGYPEHFSRPFLTIAAQRAAFDATRLLAGDCRRP
ncbi:helix-turn-helix domain-containing protein [Micromonospora sp. NPDC000207]|uniref:helix-turn-helix domain-containing protein n=1 Tax=Micromonospora sp. NPDC000207 TaxID=3154246 RepID=UPI00331D562F